MRQDLYSKCIGTERYHRERVEGLLVMVLPSSNMDINIPPVVLDAAMGPDMVLKESPKSVKRKERGAEALTHLRARPVLPRTAPTA